MSLDLMMSCFYYKHKQHPIITPFGTHSTSEVTRKHVKNDLQNEVMCHSLLLLAAVIQNKVPIHEISGAMMSQRITLILREPHQFSVENKDLEDISVNIDKNTSKFFM